MFVQSKYLNIAKNLIIVRATINVFIFRKHGIYGIYFFYYDYYDYFFKFLLFHK